MEKTDETVVMAAQRMVGAVRAFVARAVGALNRRIDAAEAKIASIPASVHLDTIALMIEERTAKQIAALPRPKDGKDGAPGRDAPELILLPSIDDTRSYPAGTWATHNGGEIRAARATDPVQDGKILDAGWVVMREGISAIVVTQGEDPRDIAVTAMLTSGTKVISNFRMPVMLHRGVWTEREYERGDVVTWGGQSYHCNVEHTRSQPHTPEAGQDWQLIVKKGSNGKNGERGLQGPQGLQGPPGQDRS